MGGQLTSQVGPPDEHPWIEEFGATARCRQLRQRIREDYRRFTPLTSMARELDAPPLGDMEIEQLIARIDRK